MWEQPTSYTTQTKSGTQDDGPVLDIGNGLVGRLKDLGAPALLLDRPGLVRRVAPPPFLKQWRILLGARGGPAIAKLQRCAQEYGRLWSHHVCCRFLLLPSLLPFFSHAVRKVVRPLSTSLLLHSLPSNESRAVPMGTRVRRRNATSDGKRASSFSRLGLK